MPTVRIALANVCPATSRDEAVAKVLESVREASASDAAIVCFPECYVPGYRIAAPAASVPAPDESWLDAAWAKIDAQARESNIWIILGTERIEAGRPLITTRITRADGSLAGFQDKVQLDPSEETIYASGRERRVFEHPEFCFGVVICHEGWRYPETVRWAARQGAHIVFHPHFELVENEEHRPPQFADSSNTFHEKAALCRAAENTCYFASVNCALKGATTTSAVVDPEGELLSHQPYGQEGILVVDISTSKATRLLADRYKPASIADGLAK